MKTVIALIAMALIAFTFLDRGTDPKLAEENRLLGQQYREANAKVAGVVTTPSGLQYRVLQTGTGNVHPGPTDRVKVHYHGTLIDGKVFDSSVERGEPITFGLDQVIPGWTEALQRMVVGEKARLVIPSELAYGERGAGRVIGPGATLIFEVELLGINE